MYGLYNWQRREDSAHQLPESLKHCLERAKLVDFLNNQIVDVRRTTNDVFPIYLTQPTEKKQFIQRMEQDVTIKQILYDVGNGSERKNIALRLWADCLDSAKTLRKMYNVGKNPNGL
jgi:hypothetical protein